LSGSEAHHLSSKCRADGTPDMAERLTQEVDVLDKKTQAALSRIGHEEKAAAADEVSPIVRRRASTGQQKVMGFAEPVIGPATSGRTRWLNPSYGLLPLSGP
jgi:hypothetical protein